MLAAPEPVTAPETKRVDPLAALIVVLVLMAKEPDWVAVPEPKEVLIVRLADRPPV
jgi:hypothetical protein